MTRSMSNHDHPSFPSLSPETTPRAARRARRATAYAAAMNAVDRDGVSGAGGDREPRAPYALRDRTGKKPKYSFTPAELALMDPSSSRDSSARPSSSTNSRSRSRSNHPIR